MVENIHVRDHRSVNILLGELTACTLRMLLRRCDCGIPGLRLTIAHFVTVAEKEVALVSDDKATSCWIREHNRKCQI